MLTATELFSVLAVGGIDVGRTQINVADSTFGVPARSYLEGQFAEFYRLKLEEMGLGEWEETWDCDDFAYQYFVMSRWAHYRTKKSMAEALAVGVMYFMSGARAEDGTGGGHAINLAVVGKPEERQLIFIEPQFAAQGKPSVIELNEYELRSIWFINF